MQKALLAALIALLILGSVVVTISLPAQAVSGLHITEQTPTPRSHVSNFQLTPPALATPCDGCDGNIRVDEP